MCGAGRRRPCPDRAHRPPFRRRSVAFARARSGGRSRADASSWSPSSTVRRKAAQTASDRTVRSRPDSSSWRAAARGAAGRGHHVAQLGRVHPGLLREERRALERLDDEVVGHVAREAEVDRGVDERLHDEEDVGRAGAADRGGHRDHLLVVDLELDAERARAAPPPARAAPRSSRASRTRRSCPCRGGPACWACCGRPGRGRGSRSGRRSWRRPARSGPAARDAGAVRSRARRAPASGA